jgi:hypothetical protein
MIGLVRVFCRFTGIGCITAGVRGRDAKQMDRISRLAVLAQRDQKAKQEQHSGRADARHDNQHSHSSLLG